MASCCARWRHEALCGMSGTTFFGAMMQELSIAALMLMTKRLRVMWTFGACSLFMRANVGSFDGKVNLKKCTLCIRA
jgi:hypothetical protein